MTTMKERYSVEIRERDPSTVDTLFLDNSEGGQIAGINDKLTNLQMLSMVKCGLTSFSGFPSLPSLTYLDVSDNSFAENALFDILVRNAPELERISLASNKLSLENLRPLKMLPKLSELDLTNNPGLGTIEEYRIKVFEMIPTLKILDGYDVDGEEVEEEFAGEGGEDSDEGASDDDGPGLSYLNKSQFSDDETEDYQPVEDNETRRGTKRSAASDQSNSEPSVKKSSGQ